MSWAARCSGSCASSQSTRRMRTGRTLATSGLVGGAAPHRLSRRSTSLSFLLRKPIDMLLIGTGHESLDWQARVPASPPPFHPMYFSSLFLFPSSVKPCRHAVIPDLRSHLNARARGFTNCQCAARRLRRAALRPAHPPRAGAVRPSVGRFTFFPVQAANASRKNHATVIALVGHLG